MNSKTDLILCPYGIGFISKTACEGCKEFKRCWNEKATN